MRLPDDDAQLVIPHAHRGQGQPPGARLVGRGLEHRQLVGAHRPGGLAAELELDAALEAAEPARHAQRHDRAHALVDHVDRLEDPLDAFVVIARAGRCARRAGVARVSMSPKELRTVSSDSTVA